MEKTIVKDRIARQVIDYYIANPPSVEQISHTQIVASYTRAIAFGEGMDEKNVNLHETAAWLHDIGCPNARRIYDNSLPVHQQDEGRKLVKEWLQNIDGLTMEEKQWLTNVVGTHHQLKYAQSLHFEPLFEADLIVNLIEGYYSMDKADDFYKKMMMTPTGRELFHQLFLSETDISRQ